MNFLEVHLSQAQETGIAWKHTLESIVSSPSSGMPHHHPLTKDTDCLSIREQPFSIPSEAMAFRQKHKVNTVLLLPQ